MKHKKSQKGIEFLMTYGWAILVVIAAVSALVYFGVISSDKFIPFNNATRDCLGWKEIRIYEISIDDYDYHKKYCIKHIPKPTVFVEDCCSCNE